MSAASPVSSAAPGPLVRVEDADLVARGGPARLAISHLERVADVADAVASASGVSERIEDRLVVTAGPSRLIHAAGRVGGRELADPLRAAVERALAAWDGAPPDLETAAGVLPCATRPVVMGILNVTPDSFSDGAQHYDPAHHPDPAIAHGRALLAAGADVVDVGGESTRPGSEPVDEVEELRRVLPVVETLAAHGAVVSIDTTKAAVARRAVDAGAAVVNDVSAGALDGLMHPTVAELGVPYVLMHMRGTPRTMQRDPRYADVVGEVFDFLAEQLDRLAVAGVPNERVIIDPGIGFGKTLVHNLELVRRVRELTSLGRPVLIGSSRKSFLGKIAGAEFAADRVNESVATAVLAIAGGASIVRVHDVAETVQAVRVAHAVRTGEPPA